MRLRTSVIVSFLGIRKENKMGEPLAPQAGRRESRSRRTDAGIEQKARFMIGPSDFSLKQVTATLRTWRLLWLCPVRGQRRAAA